MSPHILILPSWYPTHHSPLEGCYFREQVQALHRIGVRVGVAYPDLRSVRTVTRGSLLENRLIESFEEDHGIPTLRWHGWNPPKLPRLRRLVWLRQANKLMERYFDRFGRPSLMHAHSASWAGAAALAARHRHGIPYVVTEHSSYYERRLIHGWQEPHIRSVLQNAAAILTVSRSLREHIAKFAPGTLVRVVPNSVDVDFFSPPTRPRDAIPFRYLTVAHLSAHKGVDVLLRAFAECSRDRPDMLLEIGGDGTQRANLQELARVLCIAERVVFLGRLSRGQVRDAMHRANAFVLPSRVETFGVVLIEALATGMPVVASRAGGPNEIVRPEVGLLTQPGDVADLATALAELHDRYREWRARSTYIRAYAASTYADSVIASLVNQVYCEVLESNSGHLPADVHSCAS